MKIKNFLGFFCEINLVDDGVKSIVRNQQGVPIEVFNTLDDLAEWIKAIPHLASKQDK